MNLQSETIIVHQDNLQAEIELDYFNKRLRVDGFYGSTDVLLDIIQKLTVNKPVEKLIIYSFQENWMSLLEKGYTPEAVFSKYFSGADNYAMVKYQTNDRRYTASWLEEDELLTKLLKTNLRKKDPDKVPAAYTIRKANERDCTELARLYSQVFSIYPTPMNEPAYVKKKLSEGQVFYVAEKNKKNRQCCFGRGKSYVS